MTAAESLEEEPAFAAAGIPIRNLWYMLLYAWKEAAVQHRWKSEVENAPTLDALLASILANLVQQRLRVGLGRSYANEARLLRGIRGRVDFTKSVERLAFENGQAHCRYQTYSHDVPKNQIIRSMLARLAQTGQFGADRLRANELRHKLRRLVRDLEGIDLIELKANVIRRLQIGRNDADYGLMLAICELLLEREIPTEIPGSYRLPGLDREALTLYRIYERFVANFYKLRLIDWTVASQVRLSWHMANISRYMPIMSPDLILQHKATGRIVVLDTKFTASSLVVNRWGHYVFDSTHLYQLYAYLRSQEHLSESHRSASGILLYPTVRQDISEDIELEGHPIRFITINLSRHWQDIERGLLDLMSAEIN